MNSKERDSEIQIAKLSGPELQNAGVGERFENAHAGCSYRKRPRGPCVERNWRKGGKKKKVKAENRNHHQQENLGFREKDKNHGGSNMLRRQKVRPKYTQLII